MQANATAGKNYPQIDTSKPITIRYLVLPLGETTNKLHFSVPPANQTKTTNETATFSVTAAGEGPFTYQWSFEDTVLNHATNQQLRLPGVATTQAGYYQVTITNYWGSTTSAPVFLTVNVPVSITRPDRSR